MNKKVTHRLKGVNSKLDINENINLRVGLTSDEKDLPLGEINHVVDVGDLFNKERQTTGTYRIIFTLTPLFSNVLYNARGNTGFGPFGNSFIPKNGNGLETFSDPLFLEDPYDNDFVGEIELTYEEAVQRHLKEVDGWFGFYDPDLTKVDDCKFYDLEPTRSRFNLNSNMKTNWSYMITYPDSSDDTHVVVNGGLLIINAEAVIIGNVPMVALGTSVKHGLKNGDTVVLSSMPDVDYEGTFIVKRLGLDNGDNKDNYFVIDVDPDDVPTGILFTNGRMRRSVSGQLSEYYIRKFKSISTSEINQEIYPLAYSKTIFNDSLQQLVFNNDIDISNLTDNLGRPLSELYLTFIKKNNSLIVGDNIFGVVKSGFDLEFIPGNLTEDVSNARRIHDGTTSDPFTSQTPLEINIISNTGVFNGDVVEYNKFEVKEKILSTVLHRFNTLGRESTYNGVADSPRREGYLYKPFHLIKIRDFSSYIEQGDISTDEIPSYAEDLGDGRWLWRDLLDIGTPNNENEVLDYPFTNGNHYIHQNLCFGTLRQDPFGEYDLFYNGIKSESDYSPSDPIGNGITDNFIIKKSGNEC